MYSLNALASLGRRAFCIIYLYCQIREPLASYCSYRRRPLATLLPPARDRRPPLPPKLHTSVVARYTFTASSGQAATLTAKATHQRVLRGTVGSPPSVEKASQKLQNRRGHYNPLTLDSADRRKVARRLQQEFTNAAALEANATTAPKANLAAPNTSSTAPDASTTAPPEASTTALGVNTANPIVISSSPVLSRYSFPSGLELADETHMDDRPQDAEQPTEDRFEADDMHTDRPLQGAEQLPKDCFLAMFINLVLHTVQDNDVVDIAQDLYHANPPYQAPGKITQVLKNERKRTSNEDSVAIMARAMLLSSDRVKQALPVRLFKQYYPNLHSNLQYFGVKLVTEQSTFLIPLAFDFVGSTRLPFQKQAVSLWDKSIPFNSGLYEKFGEHTIIRIHDANVTKDSSDTWTDRRYTYYFDVATKLWNTDTVLGFNHGTVRFIWWMSHMSDLKWWKGWDDFTRMGALVDQVLNVSTPVVFHDNSPTDPFEVVYMEDFDFIRHELIPTPTHDAVFSGNKEGLDEDVANDEIEERGNRTALGLEVPGENITPSELERRDITTVVEFFQTDPKTLQLYRSMRTICDKYTVWLIDTEFTTVKNHCAVPLTMAIRCARTKEVILLTTIDYDNMPTSNIQQQIRQHLLPHSINSAPFLRSHYNAPITTGMSLRAIGNKIRAAGFSPQTHRLVSWQTILDHQAFHRALLGRDMLIDSVSHVELRAMAGPVAECMQPFNLVQIVRRMTTLTRLTPSYVYRSFYPEKEVPNWHHADEDTLGLAWILDYTLHMSLE
ncbi:hypothetical protein OPT61_g2730 [Boeremia exigua]|uniref:Uncharacterized protein n=1 Tax=Boeremia exigua TaxID=749465 RepID=A0ACC2IKE2_9PLEO|nr:hypothetical protein OPT61_g2730 [Boeremia exigua]